MDNLTSTRKIKVTLYLTLSLRDAMTKDVLHTTYLVAEPVFTLEHISVDLSEDAVFVLVKNEAIQERVKDEVYTKSQVKQRLRQQFPNLPDFEIVIEGFANERIFFEDITQ